MKWIKPFWHFLAISLPLSTQLAALPTLAAQMQIQSSPITKTWQISQSFTPPKRPEAPPSEGAATRGGINDNLVLTPLIPENKVGLTLNEHPTFFWYVSSPSYKRVQFELVNEQNITVYKTRLTLPDQPGIISLTLPADLPSLEPDKFYHWDFMLVVDDTDYSGNPHVDGWVKRILPQDSLSKKLRKARSHELPKLYADAGIWQDALKNLVDLRRNEPNNRQVSRNWHYFWKSVNLSEIESKKIIDCCTPEKSQ